MYGVVDEEGYGLAGEVFEAEHSDGLIGGTILVVAEPPAAWCQLAAIAVDVCGACANSEARGLKLVLGAANGFYRIVVDELRAGDSLGFVLCRSERRAA